MIYVSDTHAFLWYLTNDPKLGKTAKKIYQQAEKGQHKILLPSIAFLESLWVAENKHVSFSPQQLWQIVKQTAWLQIVPLDLLVLAKFLEVSEGLEMHDRIIVATAKLAETPILTLDPEIKKLTGLKTVW